MFKKNILSITLIAAILIVSAGILLQARTAQASAETPPMNESSSCLRCHENRYYQYDTGNHYCLTDAAARCVDCHAGDPQASQEKTAHVGLVIHPILNGDVSRCESCHAEDTQAHVDTFARLAGFSPSVIVAEQDQPSISAQTAGSEASPVVLDSEVMAGLTVLLTVVVGLFFLCIMTNRSCH